MNTQEYIIQFAIMFLVGLTLNPMNILAYRFSDLYVSPTLIYGAFFMASNMLWVHELIPLLSHSNNHKPNIQVVTIGLVLSTVFIFLLRNQIMVGDNDWLKRMIPHHSTALTTSKQIINKTQNQKIKDLATDIIDTQEHEIELMKSLLIN